MLVGLYHNSGKKKKYLNVILMDVVSVAIRNFLKDLFAKTTINIFANKTLVKETQVLLLNRWSY